MRAGDRWSIERSRRRELSVSGTTLNKQHVVLSPQTRVLKGKLGVKSKLGEEKQVKNRLEKNEGVFWSYGHPRSPTMPLLVVSMHRNRYKYNGWYRKWLTTARLCHKLQEKPYMSVAHKHSVSTRSQNTLKSMKNAVLHWFWAKKESVKMGFDPAVTKSDQNSHFFSFRCIQIDINTIYGITSDSPRLVHVISFKKNHTCLYLTRTLWALEAKIHWRGGKRPFYTGFGAQKWAFGPWIELFGGGLGVLDTWFWVTKDPSTQPNPKLARINLIPDAQHPL